MSTAFLRLAAAAGRAARAALACGLLAATAPGALAQSADTGLAPLAPVPAAAPASGAAPAGPDGPKGPDSLETRVQQAKADVIRLNRDLLVLEEELLFPASTQVAVFLSLDVGKLFALDSVQLRIDDKVVANHLYTPMELKALQRGGVQRLHLGNLRAGSHELVAYFVGQGPHERDYKRAASVKFDKGTEAKYIELRIRDATGKLQPEFEIRQWQ
jgi:hypothetical protein